METNASSSNMRPVRQAKARAMETIREYTQRQEAAKRNQANGVQTPKYDEYGLLETDSDDSDYDPSDSEESGMEEDYGEEDQDDEDEDED